MGAEHGLTCLGCCWVLMALLFVFGAMNLVWVALLAIAVLVEKLLPFGEWTARIGGQLLMAVPLGMALGLQGAMLVEIFPLRTRVTSMSLAYSVTLALAGGTAPLVATWLIDTFGQPLAPACYIMLYGAIGLALMATMKETNARSLDV